MANKIAKRLVILAFLVAGIWLIQNAQKKEASSADGIVEKIDHFACRVNEDCTLAYTDCCDAIAVDKDFVGMYEKSFDTSKCATVRCKQLVFACVSGKCVIHPE